MKRKEVIASSWQLLKRTFNEFNDDNAIKLSASLSYYTIFSLPPLLIIILSIFSFFFGEDAVRGRFFGQINGMVGNAAAIQIQETIKNIELKCYVSIASIWEIAIKLSLGKLELNGGFNEISEIMKNYDIELLHIAFEHIRKLLDLDFHHRDPFDRIIIAQGLVEKMTIITKDENFSKYGVKILWD